MSRFNYLHDAPPEGVDRLRRWRLPAYLHGVAAAGMVVGLSLCVLAAAERFEIVKGRTLAGQQRLALEQMQGELAAAHLDEIRARATLAAAERLKRVRDSGTREALLLTEVGNRLPQASWLTAIDHDAGGLTLRGRTSDLEGLRQLFDRLGPKFGGSLNLTRVDAGSAAERSLAFEVVAPGAMP